MNYAKKIFNTASRQRLTSPFDRGGLYKLKEAADRLFRSSENIDALIACSAGLGNRFALTCCTWGDRRKWLKDALLDIPYRLGYEVLPAIAALTRDGLSAGNTQILVGMAKIEAYSLLDDVDDIWWKIHGDMNVEFDQWKVGKSLIQEALDSSVSLIDKIVGFAEVGLGLHEVSPNMSQSAQSSVTQNTGSR
jgi:hypothetical protein